MTVTRGSGLSPSRLGLCYRTSVIKTDIPAPPPRIYLIIMNCPNCRNSCSDLRDVCPQCFIDLRPFKKQMGLPVSNPRAKYNDLLKNLQKKRVPKPNNPETGIKSFWARLIGKTAEKEALAEVGSAPQDQAQPRAGAADETEFDGENGVLLGDLLQGVEEQISREQTAGADPAADPVAEDTPAHPEHSEEPLGQAVAASGFDGEPAESTAVAVREDSSPADEVVCAVSWSGTENMQAVETSLSSSPWPAETEPVEDYEPALADNSAESADLAVRQNTSPADEEPCSAAEAPHTAETLLPLTLSPEKVEPGEAYEAALTDDTPGRAQAPLRPDTAPAEEICAAPVCSASEDLRAAASALSVTPSPAGPPQAPALGELFDQACCEIAQQEEAVPADLAITRPHTEKEMAHGALLFDLAEEALLDPDAELRYSEVSEPPAELIIPSSLAQQIKRIERLVNAPIFSLKNIKTLRSIMSSGEENSTGDGQAEGPRVKIIPASGQQRMAAFLVDLLAAILLALFIGGQRAAQAGIAGWADYADPSLLSRSQLAALATIAACSLLISILVYQAALLGLVGATIGMKVNGIRLVTKDGEPAPLENRIIRGLSFPLAVFSCGVPLLRGEQPVHDRCARTIAARRVVPY